jgi:pimeloyl-ACP methyl ester carboxylesterase
VVRMASVENPCKGCDGFICCIGCLSLIPGLVRRVVNQVAFFPPRPPGYHVTEEKQVFLVEADYGLTPLPDLTAEGIAIDTVRMWTRRGNVILGFHFRRADSSRTLLFSHGNSTDIGIMFHHLRDLCTRLQVDIFAYEYSGYGESSGVPSEADLYADVEAAYHYLTHDCSIPDDQVVCYGQSIGSVPSIDLASRTNVGGLILHSAMKSGLSVIHEVKTTYWFDVFQNEARIKKVHAPVFVIHGTHDTEIPFEHGITLHKACPPELAYEPWWVKEAGHNDIEINHRSQYFEQLGRFLRALDTPERDWRKAGAGGDPAEGSEKSWQPLLGGARQGAPAYSYEPMNKDF